MNFTVTATRFTEVLVITPCTHMDARGYFFESFNQADFTLLTGIARPFVQDNHSYSHQHVLRGLHCQIRHPQGKLVRVIRGEIFDVVVDIRTHSPTFGQWVSVILSQKNQHQLWIPPGFAHGFMVLSRQAECLYKTTDYWHPLDQGTIMWNDPTLGIAWPNYPPKLSLQDQLGLSLLAWKKQYG